MPFGGGDGAEVIYALRNTSTLSNLVLNELEKEGQNIRKAYQRRLPSDTSQDYYFMQRETGVTEPITVEYGFLDSTGDDVQQLKNNYKQYAEAVVRAVLKYMQLKEGTGTNVYVVQTGDSLWSIAKKFGVTVTQLKEANNLTTNLLNVGQRLIIPTTTPTTPTTPTGNTYTVKSGDSLYSIASRFNTTVSELRRLNNLTSDSLGIGQVLQLPSTTTTTPTAPTGNTYTVKSGDSLYSIASRFNTTVSELRRLNNLASDSLSIGQVLQLPSTTPTTPTAPTGNTYTVKSGDSLYSIASRFNTTVSELRRVNNLTSDLLNIGQVLQIPSFETVPQPQPNYIEYIVKKGDNLYSIAATYNTSQQAIMNFNNLNSNLLSIGQVLRIPVSSGNITYTVKSGDNLYSIANKFNTTVDSIKAKNNLVSNTLSIGQTLVI